MIDVCVCTHNPRRHILDLVFASIAKQDCAVGMFRVLLIDNGSTPPLSESHLDVVRARGIEAHVVREPQLGIAQAQLRTILETHDEWILFVDDDTELMSDYVAKGLAFIDEHPDLGCFGGRLRLPPTLKPPSWSLPFMPFLAIKDIGDQAIVEKSSKWGPWEPPTAGAFVRRSVVNSYRRRAESDDRLFKLGRTGRSNLSSCEDSLMMRGATAQDLSCAYAPDLILHHHLDPKRFSFRYLIKLMYAYGVSHVVLETLHEGPPALPPYFRSRRKFARMLARSFASGARKSLAFGAGMTAYQLGARAEHVRNAALRT